LLLGAVLPLEPRLAETLLELHDVTSHFHNLMKQSAIPARVPGAVADVVEIGGGVISEWFNDS
jgi:hypothetical protein